MDCALEISVLSRLLVHGSVTMGVRNKALIVRFMAAQWIVLSRRKNVWLIRKSASHNVVERLRSICPNWESDQQFLQDLGLSIFNPSDVEAIPVLRRQRSTDLSRMNRRNWSAASALSPKHAPKIPPPCELTRDWVLRFRPNKGLQARRNGGATEDLWHARKGGEYTVGERGWRDVVELCGAIPEAAFTCENVGAYIDLPVTETILVIFSPGSDIHIASAILRLLPEGCPWIHFGDLDTRGVTIAGTLAAALGRPCRLFVPSFGAEYLDQKRPDTGSVPGHGNHVLESLGESMSRLEQERFLTDPRLSAELEECVQAARASTDENSLRNFTTLRRIVSGLGSR